MNCRYSIEYTQVHAPGRTRTSDQQLRRLLLYPPELRARDSAATTHFAKLNAPVPPEPFAPQAILAARDTAPLLLGASCALQALPSGYSRWSPSLHSPCLEWSPLRPTRSRCTTADWRRGARSI